MKVTEPTVPRHLSAESRLWFRHVLDTYFLSAHQVLLLRAAAEAWDEAQAARQVLAEQGLFDGKRERAAIKVEDRAMIRFARLVRELNFPADGAAVPSPRPPRIGGRR